LKSQKNKKGKPMSNKQKAIESLKNLIRFISKEVKKIGNELTKVLDDSLQAVKNEIR
jgi:predicted  nucleic acid-binding Zn-ribbon protein